MEFNCNELVELKDAAIYFVTGVVHDNERLFVTGINETTEKEVKFSDVVAIWRKEP
jgi:hypothetical protein